MATTLQPAVDPYGDADEGEPLTISEAAEAAGMSVHTLRYYERAGLMPRVTRNGSGHRRYTRRDVDWLILVNKLRKTGMPIRRIREYAAMVRAGEGNEAERLELLERHRAEILARVAELQANLEAVDYKINLYRERLASR
ncbi:MAG TPA: MerR family transcriptional regulator [Solirubrobacterales bacterium]|jgi:DNA-binding transcriptional MerR regulator